MKLFPTLALAFAVVSVGSIASAKDCGAPPPKLSLPNGATASEDTMKATQAKFAPYAKAVDAFRKCLTEESNAAAAEYQQVVADWKTQQDIFSKTPAKQ